MVQWSPLIIPWERRKQTFGLWLTINIFVALLLFNIWCLVYHGWIYLVCIVWSILDKRPLNGGVNRISRLAFTQWPTSRWVADFFPVNLVKTAELSSTTPYIFGYHPHGIISLGAIISFMMPFSGFNEKFPKVDMRMMTLSQNFFIPFWREFFLVAGFISSTKEALINTLKKKRSVIIVVGGAKESLFAKPSRHTLVLANRKGFIRAALQTGASLVPVYCFGENDLYDQSILPRDSRWRAFQLYLMKQCGLTLPFFCGRGIFNYSFGYLPKRRPLHVIVGKPILIEKTLNPSADEVNRLHALYIERLKELFYKYKPLYDQDGEDLEII